MTPEKYPSVVFLCALCASVVKKGFAAHLSTLRFSTLMTPENISLWFFSVRSVPLW